MRSGFNLRKSVAHKRACLYLYRALLKQCNLLPDLPEKTNTTPLLKQLIQSRFRRDCTLISNNGITASLAAGRKAHALLTSFYPTATDSSSSPSSTIPLQQLYNRISTQLALQKDEKAQSRRNNKPPHPSKLAKIAHLENHRSKFWRERIPNPIPILQRPVAQHLLPDPSRPRRVPHLVAAQGVPFLRYKSGPQSPELSRVIRQKTARDQRRWDLMTSLIDEMDLAALEDRWDKILYETVGVRDIREQIEEGGDEDDLGDRSGGEENNKLFIMSREMPRNERPLPMSISWTEELRAQIMETQRTISAVSAQRKAMSLSMWEIVLKERELAAQEKKERKERKRREWEEKMKNVHNAGDGDGSVDAA